jgi:hypothetical protein
METPAKPDPTGLFSSTVSELHRGELLGTLDAELAEVVEAVRHTGKTGSITLTIRVSVEQMGSDQVSVGANTKVVAPKMPRAESLFYAHGSRLVREDPRQTRLELRTAETVDEPLRRAE